MELVITLREKRLLKFLFLPLVLGSCSRAREARKPLPGSAHLPGGDSGLSGNEVQRSDASYQGEQEVAGSGVHLSI